MLAYMEPSKAPLFLGFAPRFKIICLISCVAIKQTPREPNCQLSTFVAARAESSKLSTVNCQLSITIHPAWLTVNCQLSTVN